MSNTYIIMCIGLVFQVGWSATRFRRASTVARSASCRTSCTTAAAAARAGWRPDSASSSTDKLARIISAWILATAKVNIYLDVLFPVCCRVPCARARALSILILLFRVAERTQKPLFCEQQGVRATSCCSAGRMQIKSRERANFALVLALNSPEYIFTYKWHVNTGQILVCQQRRCAYSLAFN